MARILITGGAGFIGSHVAQALLARGDELVLLDNFNDFYAPSLKRANVRLVEQARLEEGDLRDGKLLERLFQEHAFDGVVHLAAMAGVRPSLADPLLYEDVNVRGTLLLLEQLRRRPSTRLVFASSSSVYGSNDRVPFTEADEIHHPVSPYAATKRAGELLCYTYHHLYGIAVSALRFFTVYGPRQRPEMAIAKFTRAILDGKALPFFGDGSTRRDYTYIDDIVQGVVAAFDRCQGYEVYNLGESETTSLAELVAYLERLCGKPARLDRQPLQPGDVAITYADISKARERLAYRPTTPIALGLERYVAWAKSCPT